MNSQGDILITALLLILLITRRTYCDLCRIPCRHCGPSPPSQARNEEDITFIHQAVQRAHIKYYNAKQLGHHADRSATPLKHTH